MFIFCWNPIWDIAIFYLFCEKYLLLCFFFVGWECNCIQVEWVNAFIFNFSSIRILKVVNIFVLVENDSFINLEILFFEMLVRNCTSKRVSLFPMTSSFFWWRHRLKKHCCRWHFLAMDLLCCFDQGQSINNLLINADRVWYLFISQTAENMWAPNLKNDPLLSSF